MKLGPDELAHYGTPRHSGRYPWGSGENPYQHSSFFLSKIDEFKKKGMSDTEIAAAMGMSTTEFRRRRSAANAERKLIDIRNAKEMHDKGMNNVEIGKIMGIPESSVRNLLNDAMQNNSKTNKTVKVSELLKSEVEEKGIIDIGKGVAQEMNLTDVTLGNAAKLLENQGYHRYSLGIEQVTNSGQKTNITVLTKPDITWGYVRNNLDKIKTINGYFSNDTDKIKKLSYPKSIDSNRVMIRYAEDGGKSKDGVIELRRGVEDISLGDSNYAQVRIAVDGTHYMKGMAMYSDDMPDGIDVIYNAHYSKDIPAKGSKDNTVFKVMKSDPDNPFGATIKPNGQRWYTDENGEEQLSVINKIKEEGDWNDYSKTLASQFLSKQPIQLISRQLDLSYSEKKDEYDEIMSLTNAELKKKLLSDFADECDSSAVYLKAAALPRQSWKVILPMDHLKDDEIYAPTYENGEELVLIRYPHGGIFEIPRLKVNNKNPKSIDILPLSAKDAVGINTHAAAQLSGADFDGDTVLVIPVGKNGVNVINKAPLEGLKDFDPQESYPYHEGMTVMTKHSHGLEMGKATNLIMDMTLQGATDEELTRAVKHSMVVVDAYKHRLDYVQSYKDNNIEGLKKIYQVKENGKYGGAGTLITLAKSQYNVNQRKQGYSIDPETGKKIFTETGNVGKDGKPKTTKSTRMYETDDAMTLVSPMKNQKEIAYAQYANNLKALGDTARKSYVNIQSPVKDNEAANRYSLEVVSLNEKLARAKTNSPRERQAQLHATVVVQAKKKDNPDMSKEDLKKEKQRALAEARITYGASKKDVEIWFTDKEWEAVQNNAIAPTKLREILNYANSDQVKKLAMPKDNGTLRESQIARIHAMSNSHYSLSEIANALGVSTSTVSKYI